MKEGTMIDTVIVDASVALSWLLPGEETDKTLRLRDYAVENSAVKLLVPSLFWYEVGNVLWVAVKRGRLIQSEATEALKTLTDFQFDIAGIEITEVLAISFSQDLAVYDAAYLHLAQNYKASLWTIDKRLIKAAQKLLIRVEPEL